MKDDTGIKEVKIYKKNTKGNYELIKCEEQKANNTIVYKISHKNTLKSKAAELKIVATDNSNLSSTKYANIAVKTKTQNKKNIKYYTINSAPSISDYKYENSKLGFTLKDTNGLKSVKIVDENTKKAVYEKTNLSQKSEAIAISMNKLTTTNTGTYIVRIVAKDKNNLQITKRIAFNTAESIEKAKLQVECKHNDTKYIKYTNKHQKVCNDCGKEWAEEEHKISNKKCTVCGVKESDKLAKVGYNGSPDITVLAVNNKLSDVTLKISTTAKLNEVKIYEVDAKGENKKEIKISRDKSSTNNVNKYIYIIR